MPSFKYDFGQILRQGLTQYTVVGKIVYADGSCGYVCWFWLPSHQGQGGSTVNLPADMIEDEREVKPVTEK